MLRKEWEIEWNTAQQAKHAPHDEGDRGADAGRHFERQVRVVVQHKRRRAHHLAHGDAYDKPAEGRGKIETHL